MSAPRDGYVFRTDLRLRPDPGATPLAISTHSALVYYESFGQNWERAALIKARPVAGDIAAGHAVLGELAPYIWRKYLDFAAIADIHAMKRQIHAFHGFATIGVAGHDIKVGRGGIREIEFFVQTQQLIAGGRQPRLRVSDTLSALAALEERGWITGKAREELAEAYRFLRTVEHRLQMVADEQTQTLPEDAGKLEALARFCGFARRARPRPAADGRARARAGTLRSPVRAQPGAHARRRQHGVRRRGRRSRHHRGPDADGLYACPRDHRARARLAPRPLPGRALRARPRAADRGAAGADRGAGQHRQPRSRLPRLRPLPVRAALRRAALLAAQAEPRPASS